MYPPLAYPANISKYGSRQLAHEIIQQDLKKNIVLQDMADQKYKLLCPFVRVAISYGFVPWSQIEVSPSHAKRLACLNPNLMRSTLGPNNVQDWSHQCPRTMVSLKCSVDHHDHHVGHHDMFKTCRP